MPPPNITTCPECDAQVIRCDNEILLDYPAVPYDSIPVPMTIMVVGGMNLASAGDPPPSGMGHSMHKHQPYSN